MKTDSFEKITSAIDEKTLDAVLSARGKKLNKLEEDKIKLFEETDQTEALVIEEAEEESRGERIRRGVFKALSVAAAIVIIAGIVYVVRIPLYMNGKEPTPAASGTDGDYDSSNPSVTDTYCESVEEPESAYIPLEISVPDELTDISLVKIGMTYKEVKDVLSPNSYSTGLNSKRKVRCYVNDRETGHVFFIITGKDGTVDEILDSGIDVDYIAPAERLNEICDGMDFDDVVAILGRPLYSVPMISTVNMAFRVGSKDNFVSFEFKTKAYSPYEGYDEYVVWQFSKSAEEYENHVISMEDANKISKSMMYNDVVEILGIPYRDVGGNELDLVYKMDDGNYFYITMEQTADGYIREGLRVAGCHIYSSPLHFGAWINE